MHRLTVLPHWYELLAAGTKTQEIRRTKGRDFRPGDVLRLRMTCGPQDWTDALFEMCDGCGEQLDVCAVAGEHSPLWFRVLHVRHGDGIYGVMAGFAVLSLERITRDDDD